MGFDEKLLEYQLQMEFLRQKYQDASNGINDDISCAEDTRSKIIAKITELSEICKNEKVKKYTNYAINELATYLDWFSIDIERPDYCGDDVFNSLLNNIKKLFALKLEVESVLETLSQKSDDLKNQYSNETNELTEKIRHLYHQQQQGYNATIGTTDVPDHPAPPYSVCIGNIVRQAEGVYRNITNDGRLRYPLIHDIHTFKSILVNYPMDYKESSQYIFAGFLMNFLEAVPSGMAQYDVVNYSHFSTIDSIYKAIKEASFALSNSVIIDNNERNAMFTKVYKKCAEINDALLDNGCNDIFELFNIGSRAYSLQILFLKDVLHSLTEDNLRMIKAFASTYIKHGVRVIWFDSFDDELSSKSNAIKEAVNEIKKMASVYNYDGDVAMSDGIMCELATISHTTSDTELYNRCKKMFDSIKKNDEPYVSYETVGFFDNNQSYDDEIIRIPVGLTDTRIWEMEFSCSDKPPLASFIAGSPGTGKSALINALIFNGAMKYSPDDLVFYLIDFKKGVSSSIYAQNCKIPHVKVVATNNDNEDAHVILSNIGREIERRALLFRNYSVQMISDYNKNSDKKLPRLIIVIDECQYIFEDDELAKFTEELVRIGRAFGIHLVMASQTITSKMEKTVKFIDGRYCYALATSDEVKAFIGKDYADRLSEIARGSHCAFATTEYSDGGNFSASKIVAAFDGDKKEETTKKVHYAKEICEKWKNYPSDVFCVGDTSPIPYCNVQVNNIVDKNTIPIGINAGDNTLVTLDYEFGTERSKNACIIVGSNKNISKSIITSIINKTVLESWQCYFVDALNALHFESETVHMYSENSYLDALNEVYSIYHQRSRNKNLEYEPIFFVVNGLQNISDFMENRKLVHSSVTTNKTVKLSKENVNKSPFMDVLAYIQSSAPVSNPGDSQQEEDVFGKNMLLNLISNGYKVNIVVCCYTDTIDLYTESTTKVFSWSGGYSILSQCAYKIVFNDMGTEIENILDGATKKIIKARCDNNIAIMSDKKNAIKFRYIQY